MTDAVGVILAGGLAQRMGGGDKCLLELAGRTLLDHVKDRLAPQVGTVILNANGDPGRFASYGLPVVADTVPDFAGPLAGVLAGMDWARCHLPQTEWILTVAADTPFLPRDLARRLQAAAENERAPLAVACSAGRRHPVFALWSVALMDDLHRAVADDGVRKIVAWTDRYRVARVDFDAAPIDPFFNINTPEDLVTAERFAEART